MNKKNNDKSEIVKEAEKIIDDYVKLIESTRISKKKKRRKKLLFFGSAFLIVAFTTVYFIFR